MELTEDSERLLGTGHPATVSSRSFLTLVIAEQDEAAYALLARQLAALRAVVFEDDEEPLARLAPAERVPVENSMRLLQQRLAGD